MKILTKIIVIFFIAMILLASFGWWLPRYLILEEGVTINYKPQSLFQCPINSDFKLPLEFFPKGKVKELVQNEFIELINESGDSLAFTFDEEDNWFNVIFEQDLGRNPFNRVLQNWNRQEKEKKLQGLLKVISQQESTELCINPSTENLF